MSKSVLYSANTQPQAIADGGVINFGTVVRRYGKNLKLSGGNAIAEGCGYYSVDVNITCMGTQSTVDNVTIAIYDNGVAVPGAEAEFSVAAANYNAVTIPCIIRETCCCESAITVRVSGAALTVLNAAIKVEKD